MNWNIIQGFVRHALGAAGAYAAGRGWVSEEALPELIGALMVIGATVWSAMAKEKRT